MQVVNTYKDGDKARQFYIGRGTVFGNLFAMEAYRNDRNVVVELAKLRFLDQVGARGPLVKALETVDPSKNLACYCAPLACHGDIYLEYLTLFWSMGPEEARKILLEKYGHRSLPQRDGVDHLNIYTKAGTVLGKALSNLASIGFTHPKHGHFKSMEHFWFWLSCGKVDSILEIPTAFEVKKLWGKAPRVAVEGFDDLVEEAIRLKVDQNEGLKQLLKENTLPLTHYYYYGDIDRCVVRQADPSRLLERIYTKISHELNPPVKLLVAGSRCFSDYRAMQRHILDLKVNISEIIEGGAKGADLLGWEYGRRNHIPVHTEAVSDAEWRRTKAAGMERNIRMGGMCDQGLVIIVNHSKGSSHMASYLERIGKPVQVVHIRR